MKEVKSILVFLAVWLGALLTLSAQPASGCLQIFTPPAEAMPGAEICVPVKVRNFEQVVSMQYTHKWDPAKLEFSGWLPGDLPSISSANFGINAAQQDTGVIAFAWIEPAVQALNLPDDAVLYQLCFNVIANNGTTPLQFTRAPAAPEFSDSNTQLISAFGLFGANVNIGSTGASPLAITGGCGYACSTGEGTLFTITDGGVVPYAYQWSKDGSVVGTTAYLTNLSAGIYDLIATDANGSVAYGMYAVPDRGFSILAEVTPSLCGPDYTGTISLSISGGVGPFQYFWASGDTAQTVYNRWPGLNAVTVLDVSTGCFIDTVIHVDYVLDLGFEASLTPADCSGNNGAIDLTFDPALPFPQHILWSTGDTTASIANLAAGDYEVEITDHYGCSASYSYSIIQTATIALESQVVHPGCAPGVLGSINLTLPPQGQPYTIMWSTGSTLEDETGLSEGMYYVTVINSFGCTEVRTFNLVNTEILVGYTYECIQTPDSISAQISALVWTGGMPPYTFQWSNGSSQTSDQVATTTVPYPGVYALTVSDNIGCQQVITDIVPVCGSTATFLTAYNYECTPDGSGGWTADITINVLAGGTAPYTFMWSNGQVSADALFSTISGPDNGTYAVTIIDAEGQVYIPAPPSPQCGGNTTGNVNFYFTTPQNTVQAGETFCVELRANDFEDIVSAQLTVQWDTAMLEWVGWEPQDLPGVMTSNFGITAQLQAQGVLPFYWISLNNGVNSYTLLDGGALFRVCLRAKQGVQGLTHIGFGSQPTPVEIIVEGDTEAAYQVENLPIQIGGVNTDTLLRLNGANASVIAGEQICVPFTVRNFSGVNNFGLTLEWDPAALAYDHVQSFGLPGLDGGNFVFGPDADAVRITWGTQSGQSVSLPQDAVLFELCFTATNTNIPQSTAITVGDSPTPPYFEAILGVTIESEVTGASVNILEPGITLSVGQALAQPGQQVCVPVSVENDIEVLSMQFTIDFDHTRLTYDHINLSGLPGLTATNFGYNFTGQGLLTFAWFDPAIQGAGLSAGQVLFEVCFQTGNEPGIATIGLSGAITPIEVIDGNDELLNVNTINGQVSISDLIVWPGDANNDGLVNHFDLLPIGLAWGASGPQRPESSTAWAPQVAFAWNSATPLSQVNYAYIDTDGDGAIENADTFALVQNWGEEQLLLSPEVDQDRFSPDQLLGTVIYVEADTLVEGETANLDIVLGEENNPAIDVYGIAFSIVYDPELVVEGSLSATFNPSWLGQLGSNLLAVAREDVANHRIDIAITRTDGANITGYGVAGQLQLTIEDVIFARSDAYELNLLVENVRLINNIEDLVPIESIVTTTLINTVTDVSSPQLEALIKVYPIPTNERLWIQASGLDISEAVLLSPAGQTLERWHQPGASISLQQYPAGMYYLALITDQGVVYRAITKQ